MTHGVHWSCFTANTTLFAYLLGYLVTSKSR